MALVSRTSSFVRTKQDNFTFAPLDIMGCGRVRSLNLSNKSAPILGTLSAEPLEIETLSVFAEDRLSNESQSTWDCTWRPASPVIDDKSLLDPTPRCLR